MQVFEVQQTSYFPETNYLHFQSIVKFPAPFLCVQTEKVGLPSHQSSQRTIRSTTRLFPDIFINSAAHNFPAHLVSG